MIDRKDNVFMNTKSMNVGQPQTCQCFKLHTELYSLIMEYFNVHM